MSLPKTLQHRFYDSFRDAGADGTEVAVIDDDALEQLIEIEYNTERRGTLTDRSGTATTTSQQIAAANSLRKYFLFQNTSAGTIWLNFGIAAVSASPSIELQAGDSLVMEGDFVSTESIHVIAASGSRAFTAKEG